FLRKDWPVNFVTGKLSDFAVLLYMPALLTVILDLALFAWNAVVPARIALDPSLGRGKVDATAAISAFVLVAIKTSPWARDVYVTGLRYVDFLHVVAYRYRLVVDPTDLMALIILPLSVRDALRVIASVPLARVDWLIARATVANDPREVVSRGLADVRK